MITELYLPCSLREIGSYAFYKCGELKECTIAASEEPILFHNVRLKDVCGTFYGCTALSKLVLGRRPQIYDTYFNRLRAIRTSWIFNESITSISIMNNVDFWELISEKCFNESLEDLTLGTYDFANQFRLYDYSKLKYLTLSSPVPQKCPWFSDNQYMNIILKVPNGTIDTYKIADGWKNFWNIEEMDISSGINNINNKDISVQVVDGSIEILNKKEHSAIRIYTIQGQLIYETYQSEIQGLPCGLYLITIDNNSFKVAI